MCQPDRGLRQRTVDTEENATHCSSLFQLLEKLLQGSSEHVGPCQTMHRSLPVEAALYSCVAH